MADADLVYDGGEIVTSSTYDPRIQYEKFVAKYKEHLTINNAKIFFIKAAKAKSEMAKKKKSRMRIVFGTLDVELVNNHNPSEVQVRVEDEDLTLHRLSGYLALWILNQYKQTAAIREAIITIIINPISAKMGITWAQGAELYLSTLPGTEMFLSDFKLYPLAFTLVRIKRGEIPEVMAKKALRQQYEGKPSSRWMVEDAPMIKAVIEKVEAIKPAYSGLAATMAKFLQEMGIKR
ncbi:nucleocapsid protein [Koongol virus]|uniref:Nucleoprotein n=2 Tax=Orthobunyavirus koongoli TaxID=3052408 RepID=A0A0R7FN16_9VIRU|nr:nucleocapsid protein [Koongol virus]AKO90191.1 nucleocapsid protein [Koongol virus]QLA47006.1 N [wongal virus] [wongal virus]